jgi:hypothetical protein
MVKRRSHVTESKRTFSGESECVALVGWLNAGDSTKEKARVIEIIDNFQFLRVKETQRRDELPRRKFNRSDFDDLCDAVNKLYHRLSRYSFHPFFVPQGAGVGVHWMPHGRRKYMQTEKKVPLYGLLPGSAGVAGSMLNREFSYDDTDAVFHLARLAEQGLLDRLKRCRCGRWMFARFSHQRFCSSKCREQEFRSSSDWKEHRRKKAREYYWLHKTKNTK